MTPNGVRLIIDPDRFLETDEGRVWTAERNADAWRRSFGALETALAEGVASHVVVVCGLQGAGKSTWIGRQPDQRAVIHFDAALPGRRHHKPIIDIARRHDAMVDAVWIDVPLSVALERNRLRRKDRIVPEESIRSVAARFEPPSTEEGFRRVTRVAMATDRDRRPN